MYPTQHTHYTCSSHIFHAFVCVSQMPQHTTNTTTTPITTITTITTTSISNTHSCTHRQGTAHTHKQRWRDGKLRQVFGGNGNAMVDGV